MSKVLLLLLIVCPAIRVVGQQPATAATDQFLYRTSGVDPAVLKSDRKVTVSETNEFWLFEPTRKSSPTALIFLPGGSVEATAYAPLCRAIAEEGFRTFIVKMPPPSQPLESHKSRGLAKVKAIMDGETKTTRWVVGGHSLGAAITAQFAFENPGLLAGFILIGTTHPTTADLSGLNLDVTKIYATNDGVATQEQVKRNERYLPRQTHWVRIEGGNHCQFGWYGFQRGDREATISRAEQQEVTRKAVLHALERINSSSRSGSAPPFLVTLTHDSYVAMDAGDR